MSMLIKTMDDIREAYKRIGNTTGLALLLLNMHKEGKVDTTLFLKYIVAIEHTPEVIKG